MGAPQHTEIRHLLYLLLGESKVGRGLIGIV